MIEYLYIVMMGYVILRTKARMTGIDYELVQYDVVDEMNAKRFHIPK